MSYNQDKINSKSKLLVINVIVVLLIIVSFAYYSIYILNKQQEDNKYDFMISVESIKKITSNYLTSEQGYVDNWANYISKSNMNLDEALTFLKTVNTNSNRVAHILDIDNYVAYYANTNETLDTYQIYCLFSNTFKTTINNMLSRNDDSLIVLGKYYIKEKDTYGISLGHKITLNDNKEYLLLRIIPVDDVSTTWVLPAEYINGEVSLISSSGEYVVKSSSMRDETFIDYISDYNFENDDLKRSEFASSLMNNKSATLYYENSLNQDCVWYYSAFDGNPDLYIIGCISLANLKDNGQVWYVTSFAIGLLILLMAIDGLYLYQVNKKIETAYLRANKASQAKTEFLSVMSHDIRTPMNVVMGMNDLAYKNADNSTLVKIYLDKAMSASKQLMTLINDILDISRIETGKLVINESTVSLKQLGEELNNLMFSYADEKGINLAHDFIDIDDVYVLCDETRVNQIYINLLTNAIKYTPSGGDVYFSLEALRENDKCKLIFTVKDTGIGMSKDFQKTMYNSFTRVFDSRNSKVVGSGLGLTIVKQVVDFMMGSIECESELNKGTTFVVKLSLAYADNKTSINEYENNDKLLDGMRLLIVEDNELNYEIVDSILQQWHTINTHAVNGKECLDVIKENKDKYDAVLMDIHMPIMDGYEATKQIRSLKINVPIIAMSANAFAEDVLKCKECGMDDHIAKPIDVNKLKNALIKAKKLYNSTWS